MNQINADLIRQVSSVLSHHDIHGISSATNQHQQQPYAQTPISQVHTTNSATSNAAAVVASAIARSSSNYSQQVPTTGGASTSVAPLLLMNTTSSASNQAPFALPSNTSRR